MKKKIFDALKSVYGQGSTLDLPDDIISRVVSLGSLTITSEDQIAGFVSASEPLFKTERNMLDYTAKIQNLEADNASLKSLVEEAGKEAKKETDPHETPDMTAIMAQFQSIVDKAISPLQTQLDKYAEQDKISRVVSSAEKIFRNNDYVRKYSKEAENAWERASEMFEATGRKWGEKELQENAMKYFTKYVKDKGIDTSKPLESSHDTDPRKGFGSFDRAAAKLGWEIKNK
ncbi:MAG: hypothetical protein HDS14_00470 [Bacteroides sp.]|nr:hypothetical protein [Bacteroides sp.]